MSERIRMLIQMSGPRGDGQAWPGPHHMGGGTIEVGDQEAADLVLAGIAEIVPKPEPRTPPTPPKEERTVVETPVETRAPVGLTTENTPVSRPASAPASPVTRPRTPRARAT